MVPFEELYEVPSKNGVTRPSKVRGNGFKMINMGELFANDRIGEIEMERVQLNERELASMLVAPGDLLFARQSLVLSGAGKCSIVVDAQEATTFESHLIRVRLKRKSAEPRFYHYYFKSPQSGMRSIVTQGVQAGIRANDLKRLPVPLPELAEQERIANTLTAYDELIENNRRRIKLLEESARLLYREWFVHLRFPGHEHVKIVDGVPQGWGRRTMADVAETVGGGTPSTTVSAYWDGGDITWFSPTDLTNNDCLALLDSGKKITESGLRNSSAKMLPPETILMSSRASIGFFGLHDKPACTNQGFISLIPYDVSYRYYLLYNLLSRKEEIISHAGGTTYKEINKSTFRVLPILWPGKELAGQFSDFASDVMAQVRTIKRQTEKLRQARDLLLPRLMSGEIAV